MSPLTTPPDAYIAFIICGMIVVKGGRHYSDSPIFMLNKESQREMEIQESIRSDASTTVF